MNARNPLLTIVLSLASLTNSSGQTTGFTRITSGAIATDVGFFAGCAWGDCNNDGFQDLFVAEQQGGNNRLYRNRGDGSFESITTGDIVGNSLGSIGCSWGDYDNDGHLDLFVANGGQFALRLNSLFQNNGDRTFSLITAAPFTESKESFAGMWGDYDNDGFIDLFVTENHGGSRNSWYRNMGEGEFKSITSAPPADAGGLSLCGSWGDYDNDGYSDLFVANRIGNNLLYRNQGDGTFVRITSGSPPNEGSNSIGCDWGDYDNDGFPDLFVSNGGNETPEQNFLYRNKGDGTFEKITSGSIVTDMGNFSGCAWGDYDNDGFLDLFLSNFFGKNNILYRNNGDGTFARVTEGSLVNDGGYSVGCAWADYDNDGFLDLFVANGAFDSVSQSNFLYRNNGNTNRWLKIKLVGTVSNRAAIGAKIRVQAIIRGNPMWQLREICGGRGGVGQSDMRANFGLGDASIADVVQIEWPSGIVQTLTNAAPNQHLTVIEHQGPGSVPVRFTGVSHSAIGEAELTASGDAGLRHLFEGSTNLLDWTWLGVRTNLTGNIQFTDTRATNYSRRFYRVSVP